MAAIEQDHSIKDEVQPIAEALVRAKRLLEESFAKLYPRRSQMSPQARAIKEAVRHYALEDELEDTVKELTGHTKALTQLAHTIFLDQDAYRQLQEAAGRSTWIPKEYSANEWLADCAFFLEHGHPKNTGNLLPIDMILHCPKCHTQHIDAPEPQVEHGAVEFPAWDNPPHRSHLCCLCGNIWRPADVFTNGVRSIQTKGARDASN